MPEKSRLEPFAQHAVEVTAAFYIETRRRRSKSRTFALRSPFDDDNRSRFIDELLARLNAETCLKPTQAA